VICIGDVTGVTESWVATSLLPGAILHDDHAGQLARLLGCDFDYFGLCLDIDAL
jgi:hypothetical protein